MGNSPADTTKKETSTTNSPIQPKAPSPVPKTEVDANNNETKPATSSNADNKADASLPPPPRPEVNVEPPSFLQQGSAIPSHLSFEPNPFEHSFAGGGGIETPGGTKLPSVAALTSPASLLPGGGTTPYPWAAGGSLRTGPLSPAMLSGPADYFTETHHLRGGFTPNESSLRTGLTPGGGGSMFPAPSPGSQALFNAMASGGATPGTLDFHRTAMNAAAAQKREASVQRITSQPQEMPNGGSNQQQQNNNKNNEAFGGQHDANDAANGLFMLAQSRDNSQVPAYQMAPQQPVHAHPNPPQQQQQQQQQQQDPRHNGGSLTSGRGVSEASAQSDESEQQRPNTRNKAKKAPSTNGRTRKAEDTPAAKAPAAKKGKANNGTAQSNHYMEPEPPSEDEQDMKQDEYNANGKKMTDDEKRKNFLERNRVAALKCRQRKKQWLANLQSKVEMFSSENDQLSSQISSLREEVVALKTMLLAHKDCPVTQSQGMAGGYMQQQMPQYENHGPQMSNPYGMGMPQGQQQQVMAGQGGMGRRFSKFGENWTVVDPRDAMSRCEQEAFRQTAAYNFHGDQSYPMPLQAIPGVGEPVRDASYYSSTSSQSQQLAPKPSSTPVASLAETPVPEELQTFLQTPTPAPRTSHTVHPDQGSQDYTLDEDLLFDNAKEE